MKIAIIGAGYVGLVTGVCLAEKGHEVSIVDTIEEKITKLRNGISPIYEPGLEHLMKKNKERLVYTADMAGACTSKKIIMICVGTPQKEDGSADLSQVKLAMQEIMEHADEGTVVVTKSTVPVGTNDCLQAAADTSGKKLYMVSNPEFLQQGNAVTNTMTPNRIVVGAESTYARKCMEELYGDYGCEKLFMGRCSAEMAKYASNNFLALKISYINEIADLCDLTNADVMDVADAMGHDPRIGTEFLHPGIGFGGSCFPKDTKALLHQAEEKGMELKTIKSLVEVNEHQRYILIEKAEARLGSLAGKTIAVLGLTFKAGTDDMRESPAVYIIQRLIEKGCSVQAWDHFGITACLERFHGLVKYRDSIPECLDGAECCFITAEWGEIVRTDPGVFMDHMKNPLILDGKDCLEKDRYKHAGITYEGIGTK